MHCCPFAHGNRSGLAFGDPGEGGGQVAETAAGRELAVADEVIHRNGAQPAAGMGEDSVKANLFSDVHGRGSFICFSAPEARGAEKQMKEVCLGA
jgi:hypothetical protein